MNCLNRFLSQNQNFFLFLKSLFLVLFPVGCTIILGITIVIPVCMVVIGSMYLNQCPQGEYIPVYLLVGGKDTLDHILFTPTDDLFNRFLLFSKGIMGVIKPLLSLSTHVRQSPDEQATLQASQSGTQSLINWFMLGWFLIGSYWIYRIYEPNYDKSRGLYCNRTLYTFSFWLVSSVYIVVGAIVISMLIISALIIGLHKRNRRFNIVVVGVIFVTVLVVTVLVIVLRQYFRIFG